MNFGPLNREGGERRLNVAVTRAKHEVIVFSGLRGEQIDLTRTQRRGVRDLKYFLEYAERGPIALVAATSGASLEDVDSEFERMVANRILAAGYDVHHQVGCSGYRIDLAVVDPSAPGRYLWGSSATEPLTIALPQHVTETNFVRRYLKGLAGSFIGSGRPIGGTTQILR